MATKRSEKGLLTPDNCVVAVIDLQPQMLFGVANFDRQTIINNNLALLKATKVDGVYTADPKRDPTATKFERLGYLEVLNRGIEVMDNTALTLCMDNDVPIVVFNLLTPGNIERVVLGEEIGTLVGAGSAR